MTSLVRALSEKGLKLAIAESLTGGLVSAAIVSEPGASKVLLGSIIAYQDAMKVELLGVSAELISEQSAVDPDVAKQMAIGVRSRLSGSNEVPELDVIGLSTTGVAGPDSVKGKNPGLTFIALSSRKGTFVFERHFSGDRERVRESARDEAISLLREQISLL